MLQRSIALTASLAIAAATSSLAQSVDIPTAIADALLQFQAQDLIPQPVDDDEVDLTSALTLAFDSANVTTGQSYLLPADEAALASAPTFQLDVPARYAEEYANTNFTAIICDPGAFGSTLSGTTVTRHYLANDLRLEGGVLTGSTPAITSYNAPGPAAGSGAHRYLALVFEQDDDFEPPTDLSTEQPLANMTLAQYIEQSEGLGDIIAMTFFLVENDSEGLAAAPTSSVEDAAISSAASSVASSLSISTSTSTDTATTGTATTAPGGTPPVTPSATTSAVPTNPAAAVVVGKGTVVAAMLGAVGVALGAWVL